MVVRELVTRLGFDTDNAGAKRYDKILSNLKTAGLVAGAAIAGIGVAAVKAASDMETLSVDFEVMLGSAEKATSLMEELKDFAAETPFALNDLAQGTKNLLAFGVAEEEVVNTMRMLGDTAGGNSQKLQTMVRAYGKVQAKGKGTLEELNMITEAGVPIMDTLAKNMGMTTEEMLNMKGGVNVSKEALTEAFRTMTNEGGIFFQGMLKQSKTFSGLMSTLKDNIVLIAAEIGQSLLPALKPIAVEIIKVLGSIRDWIKENETLIKQNLGGFVKGLASSIKIVISLIIQFLPLIKLAAVGLISFVSAILAYNAAMKVMVAITAISKFLKFIKVLFLMAKAKGVAAAAQWGLNAAMAANPIALITAAVAALIAGIILLIKNWDKIGGAFKKVGKFIKDVLASIHLAFVFRSI